MNMKWLLCDVIFGGVVFLLDRTAYGLHMKCLLDEARLLVEEML